MDDILDRAKRVLVGVTPGPWFPSQSDDMEITEIFQAEGDGSHLSTNSRYIANVPGWFNASFVAEARELVPELIAEVERLRQHFTGICPRCHGEPKPLTPADGHYYCPNCDTYYEDSSADWPRLGKGKQE